MQANDYFKGKKLLLFYKGNESDNPIVTMLDEVVGFGLYVEFDSGEKEVVAFSELSGWKEWID